MYQDNTSMEVEGREEMTPGMEFEFSGNEIEEDAPPTCAYVIFFLITCAYVIIFFDNVRIRYIFFLVTCAYVIIFFFW